MNILLSMLRKLYTLLTGYVLVETRLKSVEEHVIVMNEEMGRIDTRLEKLDSRLDRIGEDVAYIRGRLDK